MNKALLILNSLELRQKLYNEHCVVGFDSIKPREDADNLKWLVITDPAAERFEACLMYHSIDDRVKGYYDPEAYIVMESEKEFFDKLKEYYEI